MQIRIESLLVHEPAEGEGVRGFLVSSRGGLLHEAKVHHSQADFNAATLDIQAGDTLDFIADIGSKLSHNQFLWRAAITALDDPNLVFDSIRDFQNQGKERLTPWEQLAQVLLSANEFVFVV
jgi:hypothetical protein